jgi:hypothetical protein
MDERGRFRLHRLVDGVGYNCAVVGGFNIIWTQQDDVVCMQGLGGSMAAKNICLGRDHFVQRAG